MLTGDNKNTAKSVAEELNLDDYEGDMMPEDKFNKIKALQAEGKSVAKAVMELMMLRHFPKLM